MDGGFDFKRMFAPFLFLAITFSVSCGDASRSPQRGDTAYITIYDINREVGSVDVRKGEFRKGDSIIKLEDVLHNNLFSRIGSSRVGSFKPINGNRLIAFGAEKPFLVSEHGLQVFEGGQESKQFRIEWCDEDFYLFEAGGSLYYQGAKGIKEQRFLLSKKNDYFFYSKEREILLARTAVGWCQLDWNVYRYFEYAQKGGVWGRIRVLDAYEGAIVYVDETLVFHRGRGLSFFEDNSKVPQFAWEGYARSAYILENKNIVFKDVQGDVGVLEKSTDGAYRSENLSIKGEGWVVYKEPSVTACRRGIILNYHSYENGDMCKIYDDSMGGLGRIAGNLSLRGGDYVFIGQGKGTEKADSD